MEQSLLSNALIYLCAAVVAIDDVDDSLALVDAARRDPLMVRGRVPN